ncbi:MAG: hypothetical protein EPN82_05855 [Bacteroidetes bacterium]|nr:MAG: hypothetical protein EPN82_05855 [Bacteroidota bacterium]
MKSILFFLFLILSFCIAYTQNIKVIEITSLPGWEETAEPNKCIIKGQVKGIDTAKYYIYVYVYTDQWFEKSEFLGFETDSTWIYKISGENQTIYCVASFLVPKSDSMPHIKGDSILPDSIFKKYQYDVKTIKPGTRKIVFSGLNWIVKKYTNHKHGPGENYFSDSENNVWVDSSGDLHMKITKKDNRWYCAEINADTSFGYGTYIFYIKSKMKEIDSNVVVGLFTYDLCPCEYNYKYYNKNYPSSFDINRNREIDIEFSKSAMILGNNAQYVIQPWQISENIERFNLSEDSSCTSHLFSWDKDLIYFKSFYRFSIDKYSGTHLHFPFYYVGIHNPKPGSECPMINLWLFDGKPPVKDMEVEIIISKFEFIPLDSINFSKSISISTAPKKYLKYLIYGDSLCHTRNGKVDTDDEAKVAARVCKKDDNREFYRDFLIYLDNNGFYMPSLDCNRINDYRENPQCEAIKQVEKNICDASLLVSTIEYKKVICKLSEIYNDIEPKNIYVLFYYYGSSNRNEAINFLKDKGYYKRFENDRAKLLCFEIFGKTFNDDLNKDIMNLIDITRFEDYGWLLEIEKNDELILNDLKKIINNDIVKLASIVFEKLDIVDLVKLIEFIGKPDHDGLNTGSYEKGTYLTWAGGTAGNKLTELILDRLDVKRIFSRSLKRNNNFKKSQVPYIIKGIYFIKPESISDSIINILFDNLDNDIEIKVPDYYRQRRVKDMSDDILEGLNTNRLIPFINKIIENPPVKNKEKIICLIIKDPESYTSQSIINFLIDNINDNCSETALTYLGKRVIRLVEDAVLKPEKRSSAIRIISNILDSNIKVELLPSTKRIIMENIYDINARKILIKNAKVYIDSLYRVIKDNDKNTKYYAYLCINEISKSEPHLISDNIIREIENDFFINPNEYMYNRGYDCELLNINTLSNLGKRGFGKIINVLDTTDFQVIESIIKCINPINTTTIISKSRVLHFIKNSAQNPNVKDSSLFILRLISEKTTNNKIFNPVINKILTDNIANENAQQALINIGMNSSTEPLYWIIKNGDKESKLNAYFCINSITYGNSFYITNKIIKEIEKELYIRIEDRWGDLSYLNLITLAHLGKKGIYGIKKSIDTNDYQINLTVIQQLNPELADAEIIKFIIAKIGVYNLDGVDFAGIKLIEIGKRVLKYINEDLKSADEEKSLELKKVKDKILSN